MNLESRIEQYLNEGKTPIINFHTTEFERSHGKKPVGNGSWGFEIEPNELVDLLKDHDDVAWTHENVVMIKGKMQLKQAMTKIKNAIIDVYPEDAREFRVDVEVAP